MKNKNLIWVILSCLTTIAVSAVQLLSIQLWIKILVSVFGCLIVSAILVVAAIGLVRRRKKMLEKKKAEQKLNSEAVLSPLDLYALLKIVPQYNSDGSLKDIYDLLQISPQYDEKGKRLLTIYEKLGINPKFNQNGAEIPYVLIIKNRIKSLAKVQEATAPLIYYPRSKQITGEKLVLPVPVMQGDEKGQEKPKAPIVIKTKTTKGAPKGKPSKPPSLNYGPGPILKPGSSKGGYKYNKSVPLYTGAFNTPKKEAPKPVDKPPQQPQPPRQSQPPQETKTASLLLSVHQMPNTGSTEITMGKNKVKNQYQTSQISGIIIPHEPENS